jgi:hypothetical protein
LLELPGSGMAGEFGSGIAGEFGGTLVLAKTIYVVLTLLLK